MDQFLQTLVANGAFVAFLTWIAQRYLSKQDVLIERLTDKTNSLETITKVHARDLENQQRALDLHDEDISDLQRTLRKS